jgi:hypothetical protein
MAATDKEDRQLGYCNTMKRFHNMGDFEGAVLRKEGPFYARREVHGLRCRWCKEEGKLHGE